MLYRRLWRISRVVPREHLEGNSLAWKDKLHYGGNGTESHMDGLLLIHSSAHRVALPMYAVYYADGD